MQAARAFAARNPGQPLSVVFFNSKPTVALPLTTDRKQVKAVLAKAPKLARGDAHLRRARRGGRAGARLRARRGARRRCSPTATTSAASRRLDAALAQLQGAEDPRLHGRHRVARLHGRATSRSIADETGGTYAAATSPEALTKIYDELGFQLGNEYLLRYRSDGAGPTRTSTSRSPSRAREPVSFAYTTPSTGTCGAVPAGARATSSSSRGS